MVIPKERVVVRIWTQLAKKKMNVSFSQGTKHLSVAHKSCRFALSSAPHRAIIPHEALFMSGNMTYNKDVLPDCPFKPSGFYSVTSMNLGTVLNQLKKILV